MRCHQQEHSLHTSTGPAGASTHSWLEGDYKDAEPQLQAGTGGVCIHPSSQTMPLKQPGSSILQVEKQGPGWELATGHLAARQVPEVFGVPCLPSPEPLDLLSPHLWCSFLSCSHIPAWSQLPPLTY